MTRQSYRPPVAVRAVTAVVVNVAGGRGGGGRNASPTRGPQHAAIAARHTATVLAGNFLPMLVVMAVVVVAVDVGCRAVSRLCRRACTGVGSVALPTVNKVTERWEI